MWKTGRRRGSPPQFALVRRHRPQRLLLTERGCAAGSQTTPKNGIYEAGGVPLSLPAIVLPGGPMLTGHFRGLLFWGFFLVAVPVVPASALGVWSALTMATRGRGTPLPIAMPNGLVVDGPYRLVRNPMAVAGIVQGVAVGTILSSWLVVVYAVVGSVFWNYAVRPREEADLEARFGHDYRRYRERVRCWIPQFAPRQSRRFQRRGSKRNGG